VPRNTDHGWCATHRIGYNRALDYQCPQCSVQKMQGAIQYDFDVKAQLPVDQAGAPIDVSKV
jgi:hypothetical protein